MVILLKSKALITIYIAIICKTVFSNRGLPLEHYTYTQLPKRLNLDVQHVRRKTFFAFIFKI